MRNRALFTLDPQSYFGRRNMPLRESNKAWRHELPGDTCSFVCLRTSGKTPCDAPSFGEHSCQICFEQDHSSVMLPCGHGGVCWDCGLQMYALTGECPMCRNKIDLVCMHRLHKMLLTFCWCSFVPHSLLQLVSIVVCFSSYVMH